MVRLADAVAAGLRVLVVAGLAIMFALVSLQVALRYLFGGAPLFTEEVARYAMIWMALAAAALGVREGSHIRVSFVSDLLLKVAPAAERALEAALDILTLALFLLLVWMGVDMAAFAAGMTSEGLRLPLVWPYAGLPLAFVAAAILALARRLKGAP